jgi:hypothetical protein
MRPRRAVVIATAAALSVATAAVAAVPSTRHAVLDWLGLRSVRIERVPVRPALPPATHRDLDLGLETSLGAARAAVRFRVLVPRLSILGAPALYLGSAPPGGRVTLLYAPQRGLPPTIAPRVGMLITEFRGLQPVDFIEKTLGPGTTAIRLQIAGEPAEWISGRPHLVVFRDASGIIRQDTLRLAGNTLLWRHGPELIRIEANISKALAVRIARSMR